MARFTCHSHRLFDIHRLDTQTFQHLSMNLAWISWTCYHSKWHVTFLQGFWIRIQFMMSQADEITSFAPSAIFCSPCMLLAIYRSMSTIASCYITEEQGGQLSLGWKFNLQSSASFNFKQLEWPQHTLLNPGMLSSLGSATNSQLIPSQDSLFNSLRVPC